MVIGGSWRIPPCIALKTKYKPFLTRCQKSRAKKFHSLAFKLTLTSVGFP
jgi:hypothetical protein